MNFDTSSFSGNNFNITLKHIDMINVPTGKTNDVYIDMINGWSLPPNDVEPAAGSWMTISQY